MCYTVRATSSQSLPPVKVAALIGVFLLVIQQIIHSRAEIVCHALDLIHGRNVVIPPIDGSGSDRAFTLQLCNRLALLFAKLKNLLNQLITSRHSIRKFVLDYVSQICYTNDVKSVTYSQIFTVVLLWTCIFVASQ